MRHCTDILGEIEIRPSLNRAETAYLRAFAASRRWWRPQGPYHVPEPPHLEEHYDDEVLFTTPSPGEPGLRCPWTPDRSGRALVARRGRSDGPVPWLRYLIAHFLRPGGRARSAGGPVFEGFTFDHTLNGVVAAFCADTGRLALFRVTENQVRERLLTTGRSPRRGGEAAAQAPTARAGPSAREGGPGLRGRARPA